MLILHNKCSVQCSRFVFGHHPILTLYVSVGSLVEGVFLCPFFFAQLAFTPLGSASPVYVSLNALESKFSESIVHGQVMFCSLDAA
jgi:hypothetical protein